MPKHEPARPLEGGGVRPVNKDVPSFTDHEMRSILYISEVNQQLKQDKPATIKQLVDNTGYSSRHYTRAWNRLQPRDIINRVKDGKNTRLELTAKGHDMAGLLLQMNEVLEN